MVLVSYLHYKVLIKTKTEKNEKAFILSSTSRSYQHP